MDRETGQQLPQNAGRNRGTVEVQAFPPGGLERAALGGPLKA